MCVILKRYVSYKTAGQTFMWKMIVRWPSLYEFTINAKCPVPRKMLCPCWSIWVLLRTDLALPLEDACYCITSADLVAFVPRRHGLGPEPSQSLENTRPFHRPLHKLKKQHWLHIQTRENIMCVHKQSSRGFPNDPKYRQRASWTLPEQPLERKVFRDLSTIKHIFRWFVPGT